MSEKGRGRSRSCTQTRAARVRCHSPGRLLTPGGAHASRVETAAYCQTSQDTAGYCREIRGLSPRMTAVTASLRSDEHQARQALFNNHEHFEASMTHCRVHGCTSAAATTPLNVLLVAVLLHTAATLAANTTECRALRSQRMDPSDVDCKARRAAQRRAPASGANVAAWLAAGTRGAQTCASAAAPRSKGT